LLTVGPAGFEGGFVIQKNPLALPVLGALVLIVCACGAGSSAKGLSPTGTNGGAGGTTGGGHTGTCFQDSDCPTGLLCQAQQCVTNDGKPPEQKDNLIFEQPKTSDHYVFALSPDNDSIAVIDPATLESLSGESAKT
jgi:hypothetical protein